MKIKVGQGLQFERFLTLAPAAALVLWGINDPAVVSRAIAPGFAQLVIAVSAIFFIIFGWIGRMLGRVYEKENVGIAVLLLEIGLLSAAIPLSVQYFPSTDGPNHLLLVKIARDLLPGGPGAFSNYFELSPSLAPNNLFNLLTLALSYLVDMAVAQKIVLAAYFILFPLSILYFVEAVDSRKGWAVVFPVLVLFNVALSYGLYNFLLSVPVCFFLLGLFLRKIGQDEIGRNAPLLNIASLVLFFSHIVGFTVYIFLSVLFGLERKGRGAIADVAIANAVSLVLLALFLASTSPDKVQEIGAFAQSVGYAIALLSAFPLFFSHTYWFILLFLLLSFFFAAIVCTKIVGIVRSISKGKRPGGFAMPVAVAVFAAFFFLAPDNMFGLAIVKARPLLFVAGLAPLAFDPAFPKKMKYALIALAVLCASGLLFENFDSAARGSEYISGVMGGASQIRQGSTLVPFFYGQQSFSPGMFHLWAYYCLERSCISPQTFALHKGWFYVEFKRGSGLALSGSDRYLFEQGEWAFQEASQYDYATFQVKRANLSYVTENAEKAGFVQKFRYDYKNDTWLLFENKRAAAQRLVKANESLAWDLESSRTKP